MPLSAGLTDHSNKHTFVLDADSTASVDEDMQGLQTPALLVFSGGTAFNSVAGEGSHSVRDMTFSCLSSGMVDLTSEPVTHFNPATQPDTVCREFTELHN